MVLEGTDLVVAFTGRQWSVLLGIVAIGLALRAASVAWLYHDVRAIGGDARRWAVAAAIADLPTLIVWAIKRPRPVDTPGRPGRHARTPTDTAPPRDTDPGSMLPDAMGTAQAHGPPEDPYGLGIGGTTAPRPTPDAVRIETAQAEAARPTRGREHVADTGTAPRVRISCPRCAHGFTVPRGPPGETPVTCPSCGASGHI